MYFKQKSFKMITSQTCLKCMELTDVSVMNKCLYWYKCSKVYNKTIYIEIDFKKSRL